MSDRNVRSECPDSETLRSCVARQENALLRATDGATPTMRPARSMQQRCWKHAGPCSARRLPDHSGEVYCRTIPRQHPMSCGTGIESTAVREHRTRPRDRPPKADVDATAVEVQLSTSSIRHKPREDVSRPKKGRTLSREACLCTRTNYATWHHSRPRPLHTQARRSRKIGANQNEKPPKSHGEHSCSWAFVHSGPFLR